MPSKSKTHVEFAMSKIFEKSGAFEQIQTDDKSPITLTEVHNSIFVYPLIKSKLPLSLGACSQL